MAKNKNGNGNGEVNELANGPIACAFFGGRFENSIIGPVAGKVYNYDISSAYQRNAAHAS